MVRKHKFIAFAFSIFAFLVFFLSAKELTTFDHFSRLADAFLKGHFYVTAEAPWLEQVPIDTTRFFVPYPPMPAITLIPFRLIFKDNFPQDYLGYLLTALTVPLVMGISLYIKRDLKLMIWSGLLAACGTIVWFLTSVSSSWYLGQVAGYFFLTFAIYETLSKRRPFLVGLLVGAAYLSRIELIVTLPFFLILNKEDDWFKNFFKIGLGILPFVLFNFYYNFERFGVIWDRAYLLIPGVSTESWYEKGVLHFSYIPRHLEIIFARLPKIMPEFPYINPGWGGLAIWFTTPAFLYALFAKFKDKVVRLSWSAILLISVIILSHGTTGFAQFGYRFAVDFYPFLILLTIKGVSKSGVKWHHWVLLFTSIVINLWGITLNKLDLITF